MSSDASEEGVETFYREKHVSYALSINKATNTFEYWVSEHLRVSGAYWALTALAILDALPLDQTDEVITFVLSCYDEESGGFGGNAGHDPHMLYTLSAIQVLALFDRLDVLETERVARFIANLQNEDGSFSGDKYGEIDTRFTYCALNALSLLGKRDYIDIERAVQFILSCRNFDGGFGAHPGAESHGGQIFTCVGALALADALDRIDGDLLGWWLAERQTPLGGLNGRPEKKADVCYSWWDLSSLCMLRRDHWINREKLAQFILSCQDPESGGIADFPGDMSDIFHTYFGIAGLSMMGYFNLRLIDPMYALPCDVLDKMGIETEFVRRYRLQQQNASPESDSA